MARLLVVLCVLACSRTGAQSAAIPDSTNDGVDAAAMDGAAPDLARDTAGERPWWSGLDVAANTLSCTDPHPIADPTSGWIGCRGNWQHRPHPGTTCPIRMRPPVDTAPDTPMSGATSIATAPRNRATTAGPAPASTAASGRGVRRRRNICACRRRGRCRPLHDRPLSQRRGLRPGVHVHPRPRRRERLDHVSLRLPAPRRQLRRRRRLPPRGRGLDRLALPAPARRRVSPVPAVIAHLRRGSLR